MFIVTLVYKFKLQWKNERKKKRKKEAVGKLSRLQKAFFEVSNWKASLLLWNVFYF